MDPQQQQPTSHDPYQQQPPSASGHTPPPNYTDYTQISQQQQAATPSLHDAYAQKPAVIEPYTQQQQPAPQPTHYSDEQAVAYARSKVEAAHVEPSMHQEATPQPAAPQQPEALEHVAPVTEHNIPPAQQFASYELPPEEGEQPSNAQQTPQPQSAATTEANVPFEPSATAVEATPTPVQEPPTATQTETAKKIEPVPATGIKGKIQRFYSSFFESGKFRIPHKLKPFVGAALTGIAVFAIFNSQVILGQIEYIINPGNGNSANVSAAIDDKVGPENLIIIPKINVSAPVVYDVTTFNEQAVQKGLERGVVHYGNTALPGQKGNNVIVGHSSNNWWASGKYKFAFVLLDKLEVGDTFILHYNSKRYIYEITSKKVVDPKDTSVLSQNTPVPITTLITCTPPGTSLHRLVVVGKQISPNPAADTQPAPTAPASTTENEAILPGNTPSLIDKVREWFN